MKVTTTLQEPTSLTEELAVIWQVMPTPGFMEVMACLRRDQSPDGVCKVPQDLLMIGVMLAPGVATMSVSHIVKDEVTGVTYIDTVTTLVGRVALSGPDHSPGAHDTGHNRPHLRNNQTTAFVQWGELTTTVEWINQLITTYGWINLPMTAFGQKDYNAIGQ